MSFLNNQVRNFKCEMMLSSGENMTETVAHFTHCFGEDTMIKVTLRYKIKQRWLRW